MIRLWGKIIKNHKIILHEEYCCNENIDYQLQLKKCITEICSKLDIQKPYFLQKNLEEYNNYKKTSFTQENFIEEIDFDSFEIVVLEEK
ncbi:hypothetical protein SAMN05443428_106120 [Caloramator quimbayensis]|uniref:Uncharacterized protein n=1 Tax=Caloramator quimbayensis TaxID=1147123 RepID=A0A1T4X6G0_9CLOT|nr:hypothetical protein [Caloramator quimbayensis]SKA85146.1 hypothetical protein SAMN05443428_106120 [Caloramator quimbayensis]